jgi:hypothetical protein
MYSNLELFQVENGDGESKTIRQHNGGMEGLSTAQSLSNQAAQDASSSTSPSITVAHPDFRSFNTHRITDRSHVPAPSSVFGQDLSSAQLASTQDRQVSHNPLRTARPSQRQSIEVNSEYSIGAPRNNDGRPTSSNSLILG